MKNLGFVLFFMLMIAMAAVVAGFIFLKFTQKPDIRAIVCKNDGPTISLLLNEKDKTIMMLGEAIPPENIRTYNDAAVYAEWSHKGGHTKLFVDRIAAKLEIENSIDKVDWEKSEFKCSGTTLQF